MTPFVRPSIVVGIDGSQAARQAAVWAAEEAAGRDLPLRLIAVRESGEEGAAQALREAAETVADAGHRLEILSETHPGGAVSALVEASRSAVMVCIGTVGRRHGEHSRTGSTAGGLVASAHCPVAVVRSRSGDGWVAVELDDTPDSAAVLQFGADEARLRKAALHVLWPLKSDPPEAAEGNRLVRIRLDRRVAEWKRRYPDLEVEPVVVHGTALDYLAGRTGQAQLVVVGANNTASVGSLLGPPGPAVLRDTTVLVVNQQRLL